MTSRGSRVPPSFETQGQESHVLLAACGRNESAYEDPSSQRGLFTIALLESLTTASTEGLTYASLIRRIKIRKG